VKKLFLITAFTLATMASAFSQGYIDFTFLIGPGITIAAPSNPSSQLPGWFCGSDYTVQAYMASGAGALEGSLTPVANLKTTFLGNVTSAGGGPTFNGEGLWAGNPNTDSGYAAGAVDTIQVRAWYSGGGITTYEAAALVGVNHGKSSLYNITPVTFGTPDPPSMDTIGLQAFTVSVIIPEPSTFMLTGLAAAALWLFRRRS